MNDTNNNNTNDGDNNSDTSDKHYLNFEINTIDPLNYINNPRFLNSVWRNNYVTTPNLSQNYLNFMNN